MRVFLTDTLAAVMFFTLVAGLSEWLVAGLSPSQILLTRLVTIPVLILTGRPYGLWRDTAFRLVGPVSTPARTLVDVAAFVSFQVPVYVAILLVAGADTDEILRATAAAMVLMLLLSRPYGLFLDMVRRLTGAGRAAP